MTPRHRTALALLSLPMAVALVACGASGSGSGDDNASKGTAPEASAMQDSVSAGSPTSETADGDSGAAAKPAVETALERAVIATGALRLTSPHLADARQDAINVATGLGGHVADEQSQSDSRGRLDRVDLSLRVPSESFERALGDLAALGTVRHREQSVKDVTTEVIDTRARIKAQRASVESIEQLLARATTIGEIMSVERQLATRQAELDSLVQQQKWLADQTSLSTIQVTLTRPVAHQAAHHHAGGFVGGLEDGWQALGRTAVAVGTAVGAVLPFAAVIALVGVPAWLVLRRRRPQVAASPEV